MFWQNALSLVGPRPEHDPRTLVEAVRYFADPDVTHLGVKVANLRDVWSRLQSQGVTSPNGLREHDGWRYVMVSAPDGVLVKLFEFDDPSAPANLSGRL